MNMSQKSSPGTAIKNASDILLSAKAKYKNHDYQGAIVEYTLAIEFYPSIALAFSCRGDAYYKLHESAKALLDYDRAIEIDPDFAIAYYRRGNLHHSAQAYALAIADYSKAIELKADFALAYSGRGCAYRELYGEQEATIDWKYAAKLFKQQGNLQKYQYMMDLIALSTSIDTLTSGMLG
jgi:tetratricopeptide (TPR) repeat protein